MNPMLAKNANLSELMSLAADPAYCFQQKVDGERIVIYYCDGQVTALNRNGERSTASLSRELLGELQRLGSGTYTLDGELVKKKLWVFDLPEVPNLISIGHPFSLRYNTLKDLFKHWKPKKTSIELLPIATTKASKQRLSLAVLTGGGEGLIARQLVGPYDPGQRSYVMQKLKFYKDIDCIATDFGRNGKRNIGLGVYKGKQLIDVGEVTAMAGDGPRVQLGDVVCIKFLYAADPNRPRLYQPTLPKIRTDKKPKQCTIDQLDGAYRNLTILTKW